MHDVSLMITGCKEHGVARFRVQVRLICKTHGILYAELTDIEGITHAVLSSHS